MRRVRRSSTRPDGGTNGSFFTEELRSVDTVDQRARFGTPDKVRSGTEGRWRNWSGPDKFDSDWAHRYLTNHREPVVQARSWTDEPAGFAISAG